MMNFVSVGHIIYKAPAEYVQPWGLGLSWCRMCYGIHINMYMNLINFIQMHA